MLSDICILGFIMYILVLSIIVTSYLCSSMKRNREWDPAKKKVYGVWTPSDKEE